MWGFDLPRVGTLTSPFSQLKRYKSVLRPRCDGIYVGECRYLHHIRPGTSLDAKLLSKSYQWNEYRRYVRFFQPPRVDGSLTVLVLRDACSYKAAEEVLLRVDPRTHVNASELEGMSSDNVNAKATKDLLRQMDKATKEVLQARVAVGTCTFSGSSVDIKYSCLDGSYHLQLELAHGGDDRCSHRLNWVEYAMTNKEEEVVPFDLGRSRYHDFEPSNYEKDHFASFKLRHCRALEHALI